MSELLTLTGMVLSAMPVGDYDKRVVVLTRERGKITAFARGARRQNSGLLAAASPFVFGKFFLYEGRSSYTLVQAEAENYFHGLAMDFESACYGSYFMEFADYYARENNDESQMLKLLYASLRALGKEHLKKELVRYVFELKAMVANGEYPEVFQCACCGGQERLTGFAPSRNGLVCHACMNTAGSGVIRLQESTVYTLQFVVSAPLEKLYTFTVTEPVFHEFRAVVERFRQMYIEKSFKSLDILNTNLNY